MHFSPSNVLERARSSLWLLPLLTLFTSFAAAVTSVSIDARYRFPLLDGVITKDPESARAVLSVVATSTMSFLGLVFTITMVVLQLASAQYSPRITRTFLRDRETKLTLSLFLATFTFAALVLRSVRSNGDDLIPSLSVGITYLLVFASLLAFVGYLHHMAGSVRISHILRRIARDAEEVLEHVKEDVGRSGDKESDVDWEWRPPTEVVPWSSPGGVLTHVDEGALCDAARKGDALVRLRFAIGDFLPSGASLLEVRGAFRGEAAKLCDYVTVGGDRTPQQDLAMPVRYLVDVALRALSSGVNDPTTAVQAIDYLHDILRRVVVRRLPSPFVRDPDDVIRVVIPRMTWEGYVRLACSEIRLAGAEQLQVCRRLFAMLDDLYDLAPESRKLPLEQERERLRAAVQRSFDVDSDRKSAGLGDTQGLGVHFPPPERR